MPIVVLGWWAIGAPAGPGCPRSSLPLNPHPSRSLHLPALGLHRPQPSPFLCIAWSDTPRLSAEQRIACTSTTLARSCTRPRFGSAAVPTSDQHGTLSAHSTPPFASRPLSAIGRPFTGECTALGVTVEE